MRNLCQSALRVRGRLGHRKRTRRHSPVRFVVFRRHPACRRIYATAVYLPCCSRLRQRRSGTVHCVSRSSHRG
ncbi:hypothetical protein BTHE_1914 [Bifidobacterium thermophilum]|nr:hypothetical protein BTHE_1914 [Bifidobacterium thermophilum]